MKRAVLLLLASLALISCADEPDPAEQVLATLEAMELAGEAGERRKFMSHVAEDFSGQDGAVGRDEFRGMLIWQWNQHRRIHAQVLPSRVEFTGPNLAEVDLNVLLTGGRGLLPDSGQLYRVQSQWVLEDGDWLLWRANWKPAMQ